MPKLGLLRTVDLLWTNQLKTNQLLLLLMYKKNGKKNLYKMLSYVQYGILSFYVYPTLEMIRKCCNRRKKFKQSLITIAIKSLACHFLMIQFILGPFNFPITYASTMWIGHRSDVNCWLNKKLFISDINLKILLQ